MGIYSVARSAPGDRRHMVYRCACSILADGRLIIFGLLIVIRTIFFPEGFQSYIDLFKKRPKEAEKWQYHTHITTNTVADSNIILEAR